MKLGGKNQVKKLIRNALFTAFVLSGAAYGLGWNERSSEGRDPVIAGQSASASSQYYSEKADDFLLRTTLAKPSVKLGQAQMVSIETIPFAKLNIVTYRPDGSVDRGNSRQASANELGRYNLSLRLTDFHDLGLFEVSVTAQAGEQEAFDYVRFMLQSWADEAVKETDYVYPLVP